MSFKLDLSRQTHWLRSAKFAGGPTRISCFARLQPCRANHTNALLGYCHMAKINSLWRISIRPAKPMAEINSCGREVTGYGVFVGGGSSTITRQSPDGTS